MDWTRVALAGACGALAAVVASVTVRRPRERRIRYAAVMGVAFVVLDGVSVRYALPYAHQLWGGVQARRFGSREWTTTRIDGSALMIDVPAALTPKPVELPREVQDKMARFSAYGSEADGVYIGVSHVVAKPGIATSVDGAINGAIASMRQKNPGITVEETRRGWLVDGRPGTVVDLQLHGAHEEGRGRALFVSEPTQMWQVMVTYGAAQTAGDQAADRLIRSARFDQAIPIAR